MVPLSSILLPFVHHFHFHSFAFSIFSFNPFSFSPFSSAPFSNTQFPFPRFFLFLSFSLFLQPLSFAHLFTPSFPPPFSLPPPPPSLLTFSPFLFPCFSQCVWTLSISSFSLSLSVTDMLYVVEKNWHDYQLSHALPALLDMCSSLIRDIAIIILHV